MPWYYYLGREMVRALFFLLTRCRIKGKENIPCDEPLLVVANHISQVDPPLVGISLGRRAVFMAKSELFRYRFIGRFLRGVGVFPISRGRLDRAALHEATEALESGLALVMFPEGRRNRHLKAAYPGAAMIASHLDVSVLPVGISGVEKMNGRLWFLRRPRITVSIGAPFHVPVSNGQLSRQQLTEFTDIMMKQIARQLPQGYHGHYAGRI
jgi:1-acyl-sn-glycerol-3-phosphate acyltransferase